jgi:hypothetical protein
MERTMEHKSSISSKWLWVILAIAILIGVGFFGWFYWNQQKALVRSTQVMNALSKPSSNFAPAASKPLLKELGDLKLVEADGSLATDASLNYQIHYYNVQNINIDDSELILAAISSKEGNTNFKFLLKDNTYLLLTKYSISESVAGCKIKSGIGSSDMDIPALDLPTQLRDPKTGATIVSDDSTNSFTVGTLEGLFSSQDKTLAFTAQGYDVYYKNNENKEDYYVESPDGLEIVYDLSNGIIHFNDNLVNEFQGMITWNDNSKNTNMYSFDDLNFCMDGQDYIKVINAQKISKNDLTIIGNTVSGPIYGLKDVNSPIIIAAETSIKAAKNKVPDNTQTIVIFWKDPFGRFMRFVSDALPEDCGG